MPSARAPPCRTAGGRQPLPPGASAACSCDGKNLDRAFLEIRLLGDRVGGVQRDLVDELAGVEPRHVDHTLGHAVAAARLDSRPDLAAAGDNTNLRALVEPAFAGIFGVNEAA